MKREKHFLKTYQIAGSLFIVATLGFAGVYFYERSQVEEKREQLLQSENEKEEEFEEVAAIVKPENTYQQIENKNIEPEKPVEKPVEQELHFEGKIEMPIDGEVIIPYSMDQTVYMKTLQQYQYHPAVALKSKVNNPVKAGVKGKVLSITKEAKTGTTVTIDYGDGYVGIYGQLKEIPFATGDIVEKDDVIGYISEPTKYYSIEGPNLYYQVLKDNQSKNPFDFM